MSDSNRFLPSEELQRGGQRLVWDSLCPAILPADASFLFYCVVGGFASVTLRSRRAAFPGRFSLLLPGKYVGVTPLHYLRIWRESLRHESGCNTQWKWHKQVEHISQINKHHMCPSVWNTVGLSQSLKAALPPAKCRIASKPALHSDFSKGAALLVSRGLFLAENFFTWKPCSAPRRSLDWAGFNRSCSAMWTGFIERDFCQSPGWTWTAMSLNKVK